MAIDLLYKWLSVMGNSFFIFYLSASRGGSIGRSLPDNTEHCSLFFNIGINGIIRR